jgi:septum formation protein
VGSVRLVLASASPARLRTLRLAGIEPTVEVSGVDESGVTETETEPARLAAVLARLKGEEVASRLAAGGPGGPRTLVLGCDSVLELDGAAHGKPGTAPKARLRLERMRGRSGVLHTGHHLVDLETGERLSAVASTTVVFAALTDEEITAYVASGEPLQVAGAFTIDGLGGAFVERIEGDPHNVVGVSLPLLRRLVGDLGIGWPELWNRG